VKRVEREGRVLYVERHFGWSIALFGGALAFAIFAWIRPTPEKKELGMALYYGIPLAIAALLALVRARALAIDREEGELTVVDRSTFGRTARSVYSLSELSVRLVRTPPQGDFGAGTGSMIWIDLSDGRSVPFRRSKGRDARPEAARLAEDLGRPLSVVDRARRA